MTTKQFKIAIEEKFYLQLKNSITKLLNFKETDFTSFGLFLHLPIKISINKIKEIPEKKFSSKNQNLVSFLKYFSAYSKMEDNKFVVNFSFLYTTKDDLEFINNSFELKIVKQYLIFTYLKELQHILRRHYSQSTISIHKLIVDKYINKTDKKISNINEYIKLAFDYAVTYPLIDLMGNSTIKDDLLDVVFYNKYYANSQMSEISILKELLEDSDDIDIKQTQKSNSKIENSIISHKDTTISKHKIKEDNLNNLDNATLKDIENNNAIENEVLNLANILTTFIQEKQKGYDSQEVLTKLGGVIKIKSDWVKEILNSLLSITRDITHQYTSSWSSLKNQYRKIGLFPTKKYLRKTTYLYISIDQSGSMSDIELRKINYLLTIIAKKVSYLHLIIHDYEIVKTFQFGNKSNLTYNIKLNDIIYNRYTNGGTSHSMVFKYLDDNIRNSDRKESIYISFSDNFSDIETCYFKFKQIKIIKKFWVSTNKKLPSNIKGKQIIMR
ncbi:MAG: hypothetical protein U9Q30_06870 [Campylobacterota bacterium]|nr:hypothetical protein [Campylobacterota bacterium]